MVNMLDICQSLRSKTVLLTVGSFLIANQSHAQLFGPRASGGAVLGGIAGGIIGHNNGRHTGEGIAIGAGVGLLLGSIADREAAQRSVVWQAPSAPYQVIYSPQYPQPADAIAAPVPAPLVPPLGSNASTQGTALSQANGLFGR
jgi:hypothetical protein